MDGEERHLFEFNAVILPDAGDEAGRGNLASDSYHPARNVWSRSLSGHTLLNQGLSVMRRKSHFHESSLFNAFLQNILCLYPSTNVPLMFPEGVVFPTIFYKMLNGSVVGAIPSFLYYVEADRMYRFLYSLEQHLLVRLKDGDLATSRNWNYMHWAFNCLLNQKLQFNSSRNVVRRGLEFLNVGSQSSRIGADVGYGFEENDAKNRIYELANLQRQKSWKKFLTVTCNDRRTPGVRKLYEAVESVVYDEYGESSTLADITRRIGGELLLQSRMWHRYVEKLMDFIYNDPIEMCGKVEYLWGRFEFQQEGKAINYNNNNRVIVFNTNKEINLKLIPF
jgi:hypothetical protein